MAKYRKNKINAAFTEECAQILRDIKDPRVSGEMITVMSSDVSADLKFAKVYYSVYGECDDKELRKLYARTNSGKTELIVLNSTNTEQVVANKYYRMMTNDSKSGKELVSGKKIDLTRNMTVGARQSLIIEL